MPLAPESSVGFVHIPKCAGTTLEVALGLARDYPRIGLEITRTAPDFKRLFGGGLQHLTARELRRNYPRQWRPLRYTFAVVRDPVDRFVSHFLWKHYRFQDPEAEREHGADGEAGGVRDPQGFARRVARRFDEHIAHAEAVAARYDVFRDPTAGAEFCEGLDAAPRLDDLSRHLLPQESFIAHDGRVAIDEVFDLRSLSSLHERLRGLEVAVAPLERRMASTLPQDLQAQLRRTARDKVRQLYPGDFALVDALAGRSASGADLQRRRAVRARPAAGPVAASADNARHHRTDRPVPKIVWMYWHQGWNQAPPMMRHCRRSWVAHNPSWDVRCLDARSVREHLTLPALFEPDGLGLPLASLSDVIRIHLLGRHGGVWADATTFCARPLDEWIHRVTAPSGFFAYAKPGPDRPIASWFLASRAAGELACRFRDATRQLWLAYAALGPGLLKALHQIDDAEAAEAFLAGLASHGPVAAGETDPVPPGHRFSEASAAGFYFWFHRLFGALLLGDAAFRARWERAPEISADAPHALQRFGVERAPDDAMRLHIANRYSNVHKLNRKKPVPERLPGTVLGLLFDTIGDAP